MDEDGGKGNLHTLLVELQNVQHHVLPEAAHSQ